MDKRIKFIAEGFYREAFIAEGFYHEAFISFRFINFQLN